ncbi:hypothetical protein K458DRAFT_405533 [Lentithecium fluviatile CBS 122367]|uniref:F-box domain-containing protein n=1 Tax=Lentithecium fluviatile CBS 122367 TaxID=1168545 RepID=A0A6G1IX15_9PLEO|nr:hypothetical protein K458DRAFT_405533 [Lentithecium fluviatile CBS 122367]
MYPPKSLPELPTSVLCEIFSYLSHDQAKLREIAKQNKYLSSIVEEIIYHKIRLPVQYNGSGHCSAVPDTLRERNLGPTVRHLSLSFDCMTPSSIDPALEHFFPLLSGLESLSVEFTNTSTFDERTACGKYQDFNTLISHIQAQQSAKALTIQLFASFAYYYTKFFADFPTHSLVFSGLELCPHCWDDRSAQMVIASKDGLTDITITEFRSGWRKGDHVPVCPFDFSRFSKLAHLRIPAGIWFKEGAFGCSDERIFFVWRENKKQAECTTPPSGLPSDTRSFFQQPSCGIFSGGSSLVAWLATIPDSQTERCRSFRKAVGRIRIAA